MGQTSVVRIGNQICYQVYQVNHGLLKGRWVRVDSNGDFVYAIATDAEHAEVFGVIVKIIDVNNLIVQQVGAPPSGCFDYMSPLTPSGVYFLSDTSPGNMTLTEPTTVGTVSLDLFIAKTTDSGFIQQSRGVVNGFVGYPNPKDPVGTIINTVTTQTEVASGIGWTQLFCSSITPETTANKVWITSSVAAGAAGSGNPVYFRLTRNGVPIFVGDAAGSRLQASGAVGHHFDGNPTNWMVDYLDSPNSTELLVYCVEFISPSGAASYVNRTTTDTDNGLFGRSSSSLTLIQV
jgi:hypothetical protein